MELNILAHPVLVVLGAMSLASCQVLSKLLATLHVFLDSSHGLLDYSSITPSAEPAVNNLRQMS
jgi:hypothetical protein